MIRKFIKRLLGKMPPLAKSEPSAALPVGFAPGRRVEIGVQVHGIDPRLLAEPAVRVVKTLKDEGFEAYIVGGAVRDLLVGLRPKDFDVATNATPEQVKSHFRRAYIVGRRFRLVHVIHGRGREHEQIEVSTFRACMPSVEGVPVEGNEKTSKDELAGRSHAVDASGRVLRDNVWGPQIEDAARRDFTVNAMYYDPCAQIIVDYHGGLADAKAKLLRMIGDPPVRYREDPVRIIRVLRFAAKLGFQIESATEAPIRTLKALLANVPASRMFDEMIKLLQTGHALASIEMLQRYGLDRGVFPILDAHFDGIANNPARAHFVNRALADTDRRVNEGKPVAPSFLMACMFWHEVTARWRAIQDAGELSTPALIQAVDATFEARIGDISGRGKLAADMREIWLMQPRFDKRAGNAAQSLFHQPRFRAAFDFLRLRADAGEADPALVDWWQDYSSADDDQRAAMLLELRHSQQQKRAMTREPRDPHEGPRSSGGGAGQGLMARLAQRTRAAMACDATEEDRAAVQSLMAELCARPVASAQEADAKTLGPKQLLLQELSTAIPLALASNATEEQRAGVLALLDKLERRTGPRRRRGGAGRKKGESPVMTGDSAADGTGI